jgi:cell division septation protein DedD
VADDDIEIGEDVEVTVVQGADGEILGTVVDDVVVATGPDGSIVDETIDVFDADGALVVEDETISVYNDDAQLIAKDETISIALDAEES